MSPQKKKKVKLKREFSAGGVVYKKVKDLPAGRQGRGSKRGQVLWLLIQPKSGDRAHDEVRWQLPKGWIDEGEKAEAAALREVEEEGGVKAKLIKKIDSIRIFFRNVYGGRPKELVTKTITFYLMELQAETKEGPGEEIEKVVWLPYKKAHAKLTFKSEREILESAKKILEEKEKQPKLF